MGVYRNRAYRFWLLAVIMLLAGVIAAGCGSSSNNHDSAGNMAYNTGDAVADSSGSMDSPAEAVPAAGETGSASAAGSLAGAELGAEGRKIVYRGTVTLETDAFADAQSALMNAVHQSEGYILTFEDKVTNHEIGARYTIKVPAAGFTSFLDRIGAIPNTFFERRLSGTDVTEEFVDLEARLNARQAAEARLLDFMAKAARADDLVSFSRQLAEVQEEIERIKGRIRYLNQNVAYSTVELRLYQPLDSAASAANKPESLGGRMAKALEAGWNGSLRIIEGLLVIAAGLLPVAVVAAVPTGIYLAVRKRRRRNGHRFPQHPHVYQGQGRPYAGPAQYTSDVSGSHGIGSDEDKITSAPSTPSESSGQRGSSEPSGSSSPNEPTEPNGSGEPK